MLKWLTKINLFSSLGKKKNETAGNNSVFASSDNGYVSRDAALLKKKKGILRKLFKGQEEKQADSNFASWKEEKKGVGLFRKGLLLSCLVVAGFVLYGQRSFLLQALGDIQYFQVQNIRIAGSHITSQAMIREAGGLNYQLNLLNMDRLHCQRLIESMPWVKQVTIQRQWPDTLIVQVKEYQAEAMLVRNNHDGEGQFFYLNQSGVVFAKVEAGRDRDYPVITGLEKIVDPQEIKSLLQEPLDFLKLTKRNNPNLPAQNISEIHVDRDEGMVLYLVEYPFPIVFGKGEVKKKYSRLRRVLAVLYKNRKEGRKIEKVAYIRMDYLQNKVLVAQN